MSARKELRAEQYRLMAENDQLLQDMKKLLYSDSFDAAEYAATLRNVMGLPPEAPVTARVPSNVLKREAEKIRRDVTARLPLRTTGMGGIPTKPGDIVRGPAGDAMGVVQKVNPDGTVDIQVTGRGSSPIPPAIRRSITHHTAGAGGGAAGGSSGGLVATPSPPGGGPPFVHQSHPRTGHVSFEWEPDNDDVARGLEQARHDVIEKHLKTKVHNLLEEVDEHVRLAMRGQKFTKLRHLHVVHYQSEAGVWRWGVASSIVPVR